VPTLPALSTKITKFTGEWKTLAEHLVFVDIPVVSKQWTMSFWIEQLSYIKGYRSVLRVGSGVTDNKYGDRNPCVFLNNGILSVTAPVNGNWNYALAKTALKLPLDQKIFVEVSQLKVGDDYIVSLSIDQALIHQVTNTKPEEFTNAKLQISDDKYPAANAKISDFNFQSAAGGHVVVKPTCKSANQSSSHL